MSNYNYDYDDTPQPKAKSNMDIWDMMSILVLLITGCVAGFFLSIFLFPEWLLTPTTLCIECLPNSNHHTHSIGSHLDFNRAALHDGYAYIIAYINA